MPSLPISYENLASVPKTFDPTKPIYMLNLMKFRAEASYLPEHAALAGSPCSGLEAITRYRAALGPVLPPNAARFFISSVIAHVVAPKGESWDDVAVIRYESLEGFQKMVELEEYVQNVQPHRLAALEDFRLIMLDKADI